MNIVILTIITKLLIRFQCQLCINFLDIINTFKKFKFDINSGYKLPAGWDGKTAQSIIKILHERL